MDNKKPFFNKNKKNKPFTTKSNSEDRNLNSNSQKPENSEQKSEVRQSEKNFKKNKFFNRNKPKPHHQKESEIPVSKEDGQTPKPKEKVKFDKNRNFKKRGENKVLNKGVEPQKQVTSNELKYFSDYIKRQIPKHIIENKNYLNIEPLALLDYEHELKIKDSALAEFLLRNKIIAKTEKVIRSVKSRNYRTTSKRKLNIEKGKFTLVFPEENVVNHNNLISISALEPIEHKDIFYLVADKINQPTYHSIGKSLNYLIIKGTYTDFTVIFNLHQMNADNVRKVKLLGDEMKKNKPNIRSMFIYLDPTKSDYYLERSRPDVAVSFKNIFGPDKILANFNGNKYSFLPTSFSQVNESIVPAMLEKVKALLQPRKDQVLVDLFSGYGLFAQYLADSYADVIGMEADLNSVKSAKENVEFTQKKNVRFLAMRVTFANIDKYVPKSFRYDEVFILDPPKMGTEDRVIQAIAQRTPSKVLHIFCGADNIPNELGKWEQFGYKPIVITPMDLFPGSANLEVFVLLTKK